MIYCKDCNYHPIKFVFFISCPKCGSINLGTAYKDGDGFLYPNELKGELKGESQRTFKKGSSKRLR